MLHHTIRKSLLIILGLFGLSACNSGSSTNNKPEQQTLNWQKCQPIGGITESQIQEFGDRLTCTTMKAPLDYNNPGLGTISIALSRVSAAESKERKGAIFFNPGGPGGGGLKMAPRFGEYFNLANPINPDGAKLLQVGKEYDLIGFDPRGVGQSTELVCSTYGFFKNIIFPSSDRSESNLSNININSLLQAQACNANNLTPYITTDATARDIDLARSLIGDKKLNYWGISYGTWLGLWYAGLFPQNIDKFIIDGNMNYTKPFRPDAFVGSIVGQQNIYSNIIIPYIAQNPAKFNLGTSADDIRNNYFPNFDDTLKDVFHANFSVTKQSKADISANTLVAAVGLDRLLKASPTANEAEISSNIASYTFTNDATYNSQIKVIAQTLNTQYFIKKANPQKPATLTNQLSVYRAITCNDTPSDTSPTYWNNYGTALAESYPLYGGTFTTYNCTAEWNSASASTKPALSKAAQIPHILMLQTEFDGATPLAGALETFNGLANATMIEVTNDYSHGSFPYGTECVDMAVADYLVLDKLPTQRMNYCEGRSILKSGGLFTGTNQEYLTKAFSEPQKAAQALAAIHDAQAEAEVLK